MNIATSKILILNSLRTLLEDTAWQISELQNRLRQNNTTIDSDIDVVKENQKLENATLRIFSDFETDTVNILNLRKEVYVTNGRIDDDIPQGSVIINGTVWVSVGDTFFNLKNIDINSVDSNLIQRL